MDYYNLNNKFGGVYSRDTLPKSIKSKFYIVNLDESTNEGTHWVCVYNCDYQVCYYFDSFGVDPCDEILRFMKQTKKKILMSTYRIQELGSIMCGYYCIYVCDQLLNNITFYDILLQFNPNNYIKNDNIVMNKLFLI
jgi:hypothetical protein